MSYQEDGGERLREAACVGDLELLMKLATKPGVDLNNKNQINGWTPLHWASKRNHVEVVRYLLEKGADKSVVNADGSIPAQLTANPEIRQLLGASSNLDDVKTSELPITPNYLANPPFPYSSHSTFTKYNGASKTFNQDNNSASYSSSQELVLKARIANSEDKDFIEIEMEKSKMSFENLLNLMCAELGVEKKLVAKVRKLPDTIVRKDKDVYRLADFQEMELCLTNKAMSASSRTYNVAPARNHETILY